MTRREPNGDGARAFEAGTWQRRWRTFVHLLHPGIGVKRWAGAGALGVAVCSVGFAFLLRKFFDLTFPDFLPWHLEGFLLLGAGGIVILFSLYGAYKTLSPVLLASKPIENLAETIFNRWSRGRGPRVVAIGGGTGLSVLLRGLKAHTDNLTAIITVADDGGSSGRLRRELGVLPPGDFRACLVAMSEDESLLTDLFQYRFDQGSGLKGHSFGNLFIAAMADITQNFEKALLESSRVLAVRGRVAPATLEPLNLRATFSDGTVVDGESRITHLGGQIERLGIVPENAAAFPLSVQAIEEAELIVIGPGSLYTSILPNLMVKGVAEALRQTAATKVYVCNVATEVGETQGYTIAEHLATVQRHTFPEIVDYVVANDEPLDLGAYIGEPVISDGRDLDDVQLKLTDLTNPDHPIRHDSLKLALAVMDLSRNVRRRKAVA
ncbi:MAG: YvcK family protein [SAR202 cluster bacterium]|nr:YvcK family protein [SAR202 cluster bacterium]